MIEKSCQCQDHRTWYRLHASSPEAEVSTYSTEFDGSQDFSNTLFIPSSTTFGYSSSPFRIYDLPVIATSPRTRGSEKLSNSLAHLARFRMKSVREIVPVDKLGARKLNLKQGSPQMITRKIGRR